MPRDWDTWASAAGECGDCGVPLWGAENTLEFTVMKVAKLREQTEHPNPKGLKPKGAREPVEC